MTFEETVLTWLITKQPNAATVDRVESNGTDWAGDTETGFSSRFDVTIYWTDRRGETGWRDVEGEELESLWKVIVAGFAG